MYPPHCCPPEGVALGACSLIVRGLFPDPGSRMGSRGWWVEPQLGPHWDGRPLPPADWVALGW